MKDDNDISNFELLDSEMRQRLYAFWERDIFDDAVILAADPALKAFAKRLPDMGIDQCETFEKWCGGDSGVANDYWANPEPLQVDKPADKPAGASSFCPAPEPDPYDDSMTYLQQVRAEQAMAALMRSKAMRAALAATAQPSAAPQRAMPEAGVSGQTAAAQHTSTGGSDDDPDPAITIIPPQAPVDIQGTRAYKNRLATLKRAAKAKGLAAKGTDPRRMDLTDSAGGCDTGIGHGSTLATLSRAQTDPDPLDQVIPDPYRAAAEDPDREGKVLQLPYHRFLRKAVLVMRDPSASAAQKIMGDLYLLMALPGLSATVRAHYLKRDIRGIDVDGTVQHLIYKVYKGTRFWEQPNPNIPDLLDKNVQDVDQAITFASFSAERGSHRDAARYTRRPDDDEDDDEGTGVDLLDKAAHQQHDQGIDHHTLQAESDGLHTSDAAEGDDIETLEDTAAEEDTAERRALQTAEERRASDLKHRLLAGLQALPAEQRAAEIRAIAQHMAQHPDPILLTMLYNDVQGKKKKDRDPLAAALQAEVFRATRFTPVDAYTAPKPAAVLNAALALYAGVPDDECLTNACQVLSALCEVMEDTRQHVVEALQTRARNARGSFSSEIQQAAATLLEGAGEAA